MFKITRMYNHSDPDIEYQVRIETDNYYIKLSITNSRSDYAAPYHAYILDRKMDISSYSYSDVSLRDAFRETVKKLRIRIFEAI